MPRPPLTSLSPAQRRILDAVLRRESARKPNFISDLLQELGLKTQSGLGPTLLRMERLGVIEIQGGGVRGRQRLVVSTPKGRLLSMHPEKQKEPEATGEWSEEGLFSPLSSFSSPSLSPARGPWSPQQTPYPYIRHLPILGAIPAGPLEEVIAQNDVESVGVDAVLRSQPGDFLLRIQGDSMVGDGILDGDLVLLRPGVEVHAGEIAAVLSTGAGGDCEATLKRIFWRTRAGKNVPPHQAEEVLLRASNPAYPDLILPAPGVRIAGVFRGLVRQGYPPLLPP
jgi:SOS-response transcriptional repressor LexA